MSIIQNFLTIQIVDDEIIILMTPSCLYINTCGIGDKEWINKI